ncbi:MAG: hypothetical protein MJ082_03555 [Clostridia bacterium]|nr:hypothetical protein [Clostridia bacterium]
MTKKGKKTEPQPNLDGLRMEIDGRGKVLSVALHGVSQVAAFTHTQAEAVGKDRIVKFTGERLSLLTVGDGDFVLSGNVRGICFENNCNH